MNFPPSHHYLTVASTPSSSPSSSENNKIPARVSGSFNVENEEKLPGEMTRCLPSLSSSETFSGEEGTVSTGSEMATTKHNPQPPDAAETTWKSFLLDMMKNINELDMGKQLLGLAIPMGVALVVSDSSLVQTSGMCAVAISLSLAVAPICISLLLHKTYPRISTLMLLLGYALILLSFYALLTCFLPLYLIGIPLLCWLACLIVPFAMFAWAYFRTDDKTNDPEKGE